MLYKLTPEQEALLPQIRDEWIAIGLQTDGETVDRTAAESAVDKAYKCAGLRVPQWKVWAESPLAGARLAARMARSTRQVLDDLPVSRDEVTRQLSNAAYGSQDAGWLSFYDAFRRFGLDVSILDGLFECAKTLGWWWPFDDGVVLTPRPREMHLDDENQLHNENGMALSYADGWGIWMIHGLRVNEQIVMRPETLTVSQIMGETNVEIRRVMIDRFGVEKLTEYGKVLDSDVDRDGHLRELILIELPQEDSSRGQKDEDILLLRVVNSSPELDGTFATYTLRCHPELRPMNNGEAVGFAQPMTCQNAVASLFGMYGEDYDPLVET